MEAHPLEAEARQLFMDVDAWKKGTGTYLRMLAVKHAWFQILDHGGAYQPKVKYGSDIIPTVCETSFPTLDEAKGWAWGYFKGRLLLETLRE